MEEITSLLFSLGETKNNETAMGGVWGEFAHSISKIKGGLRFALIDCPNALCWTITTGFPPDRESIVVHLTINRQQKALEFIEEIKEFLDDYCSSLQVFFSKNG